MIKNLLTLALAEVLLELLGEQKKEQKMPTRDEELYQVKINNEDRPPLVDDSPQGQQGPGEEENDVIDVEPERAPAEQQRRMSGRPKRLPPVNSWAEPTPRRHRRMLWDRILIAIASLVVGAGSLLILNSNWGITQLQKGFGALQNLFTQTLFSFNAVAFWAAVVVFFVVFWLLSSLLKLSKGANNERMQI